ncbi:recombination protein NinG [Marinobacterium litorale]|uniref:recombination protein NinG n=1 Tax=Marinobacterium litorale TaxID=404770 RepID=UPI0003F5BEDB|nr:recombination protein NinG [Marinobacterium litorale]
MTTATLKCRHCKERKPRETMLKVPIGAFCDGECARQYAIAKVSKDRQADKRRKHREAKDRLRGDSLPHQLELTQKAFNAMIRELDKDQPCVSCGKPAGQYTLTAGHYQTVGAHPELRFDPRNCAGQCSGCNSGVQRYAKGDKASTRQKFTAELVRRYGQELVDYLTGPHPAKHYTCDELKEMRKVFNAEKRRLEKGEPPSRDWRALDPQELIRKAG